MLYTWCIIAKSSVHMWVHNYSNVVVEVSAAWYRLAIACMHYVCYTYDWFLIYNINTQKEQDGVERKRYTNNKNTNKYGSDAFKSLKRTKSGFVIYLSILNTQKRINKNDWRNTSQHFTHEPRKSACKNASNLFRFRSSPKSVY